MDNVVNLAKVFQQKVFLIPDYQRGYAWDSPQCNDLMEDIDILPSNKDHYTGTLVLHPQFSSDSNAQGSQKSPILMEDFEGNHHALCHVVDGQQRLTTIILLLDAIRQQLSETNDPSLKALSDGIKKNYISTKSPNEQPLYKLQLNSDCDEFFRKNIISDFPSIQGPSIQSHQRLLIAKNFFTAYLSAQRKVKDSSFFSYLKDLHYKVTQHLKVSLYEVEDTADVGVIFEVMNNRGKPLSELEKVKNYLLYLSSKINLDTTELTSAINLAWANIFERLMKAGLGGNDEDQLLRAHWLMSYDYDRRNWDGSKSIKARYNLRDYKGMDKELLSDLIRYIQTLSDSAIAYCDIMKPMHSNSFASFSSDPISRGRISNAGEKLRRLKVLAPFLPILISIRLRFSQEPKTYLSMLELCEKFAFRVYRYMGKRSNAGQSSFFKYGFEIFNDKRTVEQIQYDINWWINYYCPYKKWIDYFNLGDDWYQWYGLKYFLYEYEEYLSGADSVRVHWDEIDSLDKEKSIEHILPQTPEGISYWEIVFSSDERKLYTHDIGNLSFTKDNSSYGRKSFPDKCGSAGAENPCYSNSSLAIERDICRFRQKYTDWKKEALLARRAEIIKWAQTRWYVEPIDTDGIGNVSVAADEDIDQEE